ncbi:hypothetical protein [Rhodococcus sp. B50]|uniref:hypothetical protein n=1 Tax=Rhodococcus sp. B50 TaxID=2682847 RepID=UPI001BD1DA6E|nr:hypothetical protein [Rhodococcus sp. B50]MBS9375898.1 hypothetical protein [Rhodococcus sp. B50]
MQGSGPLREGSIPSWWQRTTLAEERKRLVAEAARPDQFVESENDRTRLAEDETVRLGALILAEAFTPASIQRLYGAIDSWPVNPPAYKNDLKRKIANWRSSSGYGAWQSVTTFTKPGNRFIGSAVKDSNVPDPIEAVHLFAMMASPSVTLIVAVFIPHDSDGDFSPILSKDFPNEVRNVRIRLPGPMGTVRAKNPWSRAKNPYYSMHVAYPSILKREAVDTKIAYLEAHCWEWMSGMGVGRFGSIPLDDRPSMRLFVTEGIEPFGDRRHALQAVDLDYSTQLWSYESRNDYYFALGDSYGPQERRVAVIAATRDNLNSVTGADRSAGQASILGLVDAFSRNHTELIGVWALAQLLDRYRHEISSIRDSITQDRSSIRTARRLNEFLWTDGNDTTIIAKDVARLTAKDSYFGHRIDPLIDVNQLQHSSDAEVPPKYLRQELREQLNKSASDLVDESDAAIRSISSSSQLLQSISDTNLQRMILAFTICAVVIALVALFVSG